MNCHALKTITEEVYCFLEKYQINEFEIETKSTTMAKRINVTFSKDFVLSHKINLGIIDIGRIEQTLLDGHEMRKSILKSNKS